MRLPANEAKAEANRCADAADLHRQQAAQLHEARRANEIADQQARSAFVQTLATVAAFLAAVLAAFFAYRATHWAREAATHTKRSADADNEALEETRKAAEDARRSDVQQAKRLTEQLGLMDKTMQYTAETAYAMKDNARAVAAQIDILKDTASKQLRAYVHVEALTMSWTETYPVFRVKIVNTGKTPATSVRSGGLVILGDRKAIVAIQAVPENVSLGGNTVIGAESFNETVLVADGYEAIRKNHISSDSMLYVYGSVEYEDVFSIRYKTDFGFFTSNAQITDLSPTQGRSFVMFQRVNGKQSHTPADGR